MGATGSAYFERWVSSDSGLNERYTALEQKITIMEQKHDALIKKVDDTVFELVSRVDTVEKRATNMIFQQEEPECDLVIIR